MCLKKFICIFLLFSSLHCFAQESQPDTTKINMTDLWNNIELNLSSLEIEQTFSQTRLVELEKKLEQSEKALESKELLYQNLKSSLEKSEQDTKRWKTCSIVLGTTTVTFGLTTAATILLLRYSR